MVGSFADPQAGERSLISDVGYHQTLSYGKRAIVIVNWYSVLEIIKEFSHKISSGLLLYY